MINNAKQGGPHHHAVNENRSWLLGEILIQNGWLEWDELEDALTVQQETGRRLGDILLASNLVFRNQLYRALAIQHGQAVVDLSQVVPDPDLLDLIPKRYAQEFHILPVFHSKHTLIVAASHFETAWIKSALHAMTKIPRIDTMLALSEDIEKAIHRAYGPAATISFKF